MSQELIYKLRIYEKNRYKGARYEKLYWYYLNLLTKPTNYK